MKMKEENYDELEQYAYPDSEYIEKAAEYKYSSPIGLFLSFENVRLNHSGSIMPKQI